MLTDGWRNGMGCPFTYTRPVASRSSPNSASAISVRPAPTKPAKPRTSPACNENENVLKFTGTGEIFHAEQFFAGFGLQVTREICFQCATDHHLDQRVLVEVLHGFCSYVLTVAQHGDRVAQLVNLFEAMRHVDGRHALFLQPLDQFKQVLGFRLRQAARRLVENQDARAMRHRGGDLDKLLLADGQLADQPGRIDLRLDGAKIFPRPTPHFAAGDECRARRQLAEAEVLGDRQVFTERKFLVDDADARGHRGARVCESDRLAVDNQFAVVGRVNAGQNFAERALARRRSPRRARGRNLAPHQSLRPTAPARRGNVC